MNRGRFRTAIGNARILGMDQTLALTWEIDTGAGSIFATSGVTSGRFLPPALWLTTRSIPQTWQTGTAAPPVRQPRAAVRLDDRRVSQFQCLIDDQDGVLTLLDLGSVSGTFVNGVRLSMATLLHGDHLTIGATDFVVQIL